MKAVTGAVIIAMLISATSATAALLVTSKHIKDGTIQTVDISTKAKRALRGNRGPAGLSELEVVTAHSEFHTFLVYTQTVTCPSGKTAVGGGGSIDERGRTVGLTSNKPFDKDTWEVQATRFIDVAFQWRLSAYAVCARTE